jgi:hypothetical protein
MDTQRILRCIGCGILSFLRNGYCLRCERTR